MFAKIAILSMFSISACYSSFIELRSKNAEVTYVNKPLPSCINDQAAELELLKIARENSREFNEILEEACRNIAVFERLGKNITAEKLFSLFKKKEWLGGIHSLNTTITLLLALKELGFPDGILDYIAYRSAVLMRCKQKIRLDDATLQEKLAKYCFLIHKNKLDETELDISIDDFCEFRDFEEIVQKKYDPHIRVSPDENLLSRIVDSFMEGPAFNTLLLSNNNISDLSGFEKLLTRGNIKRDQVEILDLSGNRIEDIPDSMLTGFTNLKKICLNNNKLITIPADLLTMCPRLQIVELANNCLETVPKELVDPSMCAQYELRVIDLRLNPLVDLPPELFLPDSLEEVYLPEGSDFIQLCAGRRPFLNPDILISRKIKILHEDHMTKNQIPLDIRAAAWALKGEFLYIQNKHTQAVEYFKKAEAQNDDPSARALAQFYLGKCVGWGIDFDEAYAYLNSVVTQDLIPHVTARAHFLWGFIRDRRTKRLYKGC